MNQKNFLSSLHFEDDTTGSNAMDATAEIFGKPDLWRSENRRNLWILQLSVCLSDPCRGRRYVGLFQHDNSEEMPMFKITLRVWYILGIEQKRSRYHENKEEDNSVCQIVNDISIRLSAIKQARPNNYCLYRRRHHPAKNQATINKAHHQAFSCTTP